MSPCEIMLQRNFSQWFLKAIFNEANLAFTELEDVDKFLEKTGCSINVLSTDLKR